MKIAIINRHKKDTYGGSEVQCDIIARQLENFGHEIIYLAIEGKRKYSNTYKTVSVNSSGDIVEACRHEQPDIIYWRYNKNHFLKTTWQLSELSIPIVFAVSHINDIKRWKTAVLEEHKNFFKKLVIYLATGINHWWNHLGFRYVSGVVVNNEQFLKSVSNPSKIHIQSSVENHLKSFSWKKPYIVWVSSLKPAKRPEVCIDVAKALKEKGIDVLMIGPIQKSGFENFKHSIENFKNLHYLGAKPNKVVNGAIYESICLIHTGKPEGFPNVFMQAWQYGKPVVSLEYDPDQLLESKGLGLVSNDDLNTFNTNIKRIIDNKKLRNKLSASAKSYSDKYLSPERNSKKLEDFFLQIIDNYDQS